MRSREEEAGQEGATRNGAGLEEKGSRRRRVRLERRGEAAAGGAGGAARGRRQPSVQHGGEEA
jgi:hypothetical protein